MPEEKLFRIQDPAEIQGVVPYLAWSVTGHKTPCLGLNIYVQGLDKPVRIKRDDFQWLITRYLESHPVVISKKPWKSAHYQYIMREATAAEIAQEDSKNVVQNNDVDVSGLVEFCVGCASSSVDAGAGI